MTLDSGKGIAENQSSTSRLRIWRAAQSVVLGVGIALVGVLILFPDIGAHLFWNLIIPVAPALVVVIPGVWRNICPMSCAAMLPRHLGFSKKQILSEDRRAMFVLLGFIALLLIVCVRHLGLNTSGWATAFMFISASLIAMFLGWKYEWKSAWCSGLCPIYPVEKLYGTQTAVTVQNAHCTACEKCVVPCPDSTKSMNTIVTSKNRIDSMVGIAMVGGFFGYILGWYHVPDYSSPISGFDVFYAFAMPLGGFAISLMIFLSLYVKAPKQRRQMLIRIFSMASIVCYYWYRIPMLFGFGEFEGQGVLVDLTNILPSWFPMLSQIITTSFFIWFMMLRNNEKKSWLVRPIYSDKVRFRS